MRGAPTGPTIARKDGTAQTSQLGANCVFFAADDKATLTGQALGKSASFTNP